MLWLILVVQYSAQINSEAKEMAERARPPPAI